MPLQAIPYIVLLGFFYGSTLIVSRFSVGQYAPTTYIGLRLIIAASAHVLIYAIARGRHWPTDRNLWKHAIILGVIGTAIPMTSIVSGLQYLSSGIASILITTNPALTVLFAHFFLSDEKLTWRKSIGIIIALSGAAVLALSGESGIADPTNQPWIGYALLAVAMVIGSSSTIYARKFMSEMDSFDVASVRMLSASLVVLPLSYLFIGFDLSEVTPLGYAGLGYAALVGTFSGMLLAFYNIKHFGATASAMTAYVIPVVATVGGYLFLDEIITVNMLGGMGLIILGIGIINQRQQAQKEQEQEVEPAASSTV